MSSPPSFNDAEPLEVVLRYVMDAGLGGPPTSLDSLIELLAQQPGCERCWIGRSTDDPARWVVGSRWSTVGAYRRALSSYDVKARGSQILGAAEDEPSAFEVLVENIGGSVFQRHSARSQPDDDERRR